MSLLQMSFAASVMILFIIVIRTLFINKLPKKTFLVLWGAVLFRLLIPFSIPTKVSIYSFMNTTPVADSAARTAIIKIIPITALTPSMAAPIAIDEQTTRISLFTIIWGIGLICCALFFMIVYFRCRREFKSSINVQNEIVDRWLFEHKMLRKIQIRQSSRISSPLTYGFLHPVILMPQNTDWKDSRQLQYILTHEYVHIRRFDAITKLVITAALCVHWFNPLVWAMYILSNRDIELSCDESVVRTFGGTVKSEYALTLISIEEKKSSFLPLCNNFSKNAIEERITAIMKIKKTSLVAIVAAVILITGITTAFATSAIGKNIVLASIPNTAFTTDEYDKILALRFEGYEAMTIAQYREKLLIATDTDEYMDLLERISQDTQLQTMRYTNDTASFLLNTLVPIRAEKWERRDFNNSAQATKSTDSEGATLEYTLTCTITDGNRLTVGEHDRAIRGVTDGLQELLKNKSSVELQDKNRMNAAIDEKFETLKDKWETKALQLSISYSYLPLYIYDKPQGREISKDGEISTDGVVSTDSEEEHGTPGTEADYQSLIALKTADYQNQTIAGFNNNLLDWSNNNIDSMERISMDVGWNDIRVNLTDEERNFVTLTVELSGTENAAYVKSNYTGEVQKDPVLGYYTLNKEGDMEEVRGARSNLDYRITYHISDKNKLTIGERDRSLAGVMKGIQELWDTMTLEDVLATNKETIGRKLASIADQYSNKLLEIDVIDVRLENHDERNLEKEAN